MTIIYVTGFISDKKNLSNTHTYIAQLIAASLLPLCGLYMYNLYGLFGIYEISPWFGIPLTMFLIMFVSNSIKLIEDNDGIVASICTLAKGKKIFMGKSDTLLLGYMLSFFTLRSYVYLPEHTQANDYTPLILLTLLIIPTFDTVRILYVRMMQKRTAVPQLGKCNIHHKLLDIGLNLHHTLGIIIVAELLYIALNYALYNMEFNCNIIIAVDAVIFIFANWLLNILKKED